MSPPAAQVKLLYFGLRGRAEVVRLTLQVGGVKYKEEIVSQKQWPGIKHCKSQRKREGGNTA